MDPLCCEAAGGTPLGEGSTCGGAQEGCCFPDNTCLNLDSACCTLQGGTPQGEGTECGGLAGCCLPEGAGCVNMDPLCCDEAGGTPQDGLCATGGTSDCCTASGGLGCDNEDCEATVCAVDPFCCDTSWDSICAEEAVDLCGGLCAATVQGCCLPDGTCIEIDPLCCEEAGGTPTGGSCTTEGCCFPDNTCQDLDPECCVLEGGTPQGEGSACNGIEACCLEDGTCEEMDPLCCDEAGGTPQGPGSTCGGEVQGCCLPDGTCENLDPTCCTAQDGTPVTGTCTASEACCLPDDTCVDMDPLCCALQGGTSQGPGSTCATTTCGGGEGCTPGYWKLIDISPGNASHECNWTDPYDPTDLFSDHFENAFPGKTLVQVLGLSGGGLNALGRHTVAALLNAASADVDFGQSPQDVIDAFNAVFPGTNAQYEELKNEFAAGNESCCPIGNCKCTAGTQKLCNLSGSQACGAGQGTCANSSDAAENCD
jgi:hypothetical protein